jgi:uncharacterized membrane protein
MALGSLLLVLLSALLHALWNALIKRERDTEAATVGVLISAAVTATIVAAISAVGGGAFPGARAFAWALAAGLGEGFYFLTLGRALARAPLGLAYTVARGGAIVAVWPLSVWLLGEPLTSAAAGGALLVLMGLVTTGGAERARFAAGLGWSAACALSITGYHLAYKQALGAGARPSALFAVSLVLALALNLWRLPDARQRLAQLARTRLPPLLLGGLLCTAAFLILLHALAGAGAGAVLTLRNTSVVFAQLLGALLGESLRPRQVLGGLLVVAGAILIGWPR